MTDMRRVGKYGTVAIPARLLRRYGIEEGSFVLVEAGPEGVVIRPADAAPSEVYSPERRATLLLEMQLTLATMLGLETKSSAWASIPIPFPTKGRTSWAR